MEQYWHLPRTNTLITEHEAAEEFRRLFKQAVRRQLVADVPVAAFLSGGLDSDSVAATAAQEYAAVVLTGDAGDEILGGCYDKYAKMTYIMRLQDMPYLLRKLHNKMTKAQYTFSKKADKLLRRARLIDAKVAAEINEKQNKGGCVTMFDPIGAYLDSKIEEAFNEGKERGKKQGMAQGRMQTIDCV